ncbi:TPA: hypothetical protein ACKQCZ_004000, partial [Stenotrophomonas maltophilia]
IVSIDSRRSQPAPSVEFPSARHSPTGIRTRRSPINPGLAPEISNLAAIIVNIPRRCREYPYTP